MDVFILSGCATFLLVVLQLAHVFTKTMLGFVSSLSMEKERKRTPHVNHTSKEHESSSTCSLTSMFGLIVLRVRISCKAKR